MIERVRAWAARRRIAGRGGARPWQLAIVTVLAGAAALVVWGTDGFDGLELDTVDARFEVRGAEPPPEEIVTVAIDSATFAELQERWPFSRRRHAEAIENLRRDGAAVIAYDVQFTEPSDDPRADNALIRAVARAPEVVLSTTEVGPRGQTNVLGGDAVLRRIGARAGSTVLPGDSDGVIRRVRHSHGSLEGFATTAVEMWSDREVGIEEFDRDGFAWIDYHGGPGSFHEVPFWRVATGEFEPGTFTGKLVVVGATASSLQDLHTTAVTDQQLMSGAEIQANAISSVSRGNPLSEAPAALDVALILLGAALAPAASAALSPLRALLVALAAGGAYALAVQLAFNSGTILPLLYPLLALALAAIGMLAVQYLATAFERRRVRDLFARFVPEDVVDDVLARTDEDLRLGGVEVEGTVLFSDIRGFTGFSETQSAARVVAILNRYLGAMSDAILEHGGTITSYMGDGIMAVFGAPIAYPDHADRALAAARTMLYEELPKFNQWLRAEHAIDGFEMGIGLNSGPVMSGNVGSDRRLEYTAIGDAVNTASRLEGMTKGSGYQLFIADSTRAALRNGEPPGLVFVDELEVRGKRARVKIWSLASA